MAPRLPLSVGIVDHIFSRPDATGEDRLRVRFLAAMGILMSGGGVLWTGMLLAAGFPGPAMVPGGYAVLTAMNLTVLARTRRFAPARIVQVSISLLLPFLLQWSLGGFVASGMVMMWAMLALVGSLTFSTTRQTLGALVAFVALTLVSGMVDSTVADWAGVGPVDSRLTLFFVVNGTLVSSMVFGLTTYLDVRRQSDTDALRNANATICELNTELRGRADRAAEEERVAHDANRAKSTFLANMSHELRTPLNAIIGYAELIADEHPDEDAGSDADQIARAGSHLLLLINSVLDLAKIEAGKMTVTVESVQVDRVMASVRATLAPLVEANANQLMIEVPEGTEVTTDSLKLRQILFNLVSNANKFTQRGTISVRVEHIDDALHIEVSDTGIGMTPEQLARVRLPYQQADASTTRCHGGTGLGLHLVEQFVTMLGGTLVLESAVGVGTTARVTLLAPPARQSAHRHLLLSA